MNRHVRPLQILVAILLLAATAGAGLPGAKAKAVSPYAYALFFMSDAAVETMRNAKG
jgi:hypothetical protein